MPGKDEDEDELGVVGVEDMIQLMDLSEHTLLKNIQIRYNNGSIYTYTGSILVSVNPYKMFNIYGLDVVKRYEGQVLGALPPHLFAIGSAAYDKMVLDKENQVVVISGESGAGKTEATKLTMQYLAAVNKSGSNLITEQILEASPLLESFGNSKTIRNDNSSRFGKYLEVYFRGGSITGARTSEFLLEKSRIVTQSTDERNYHIFYEMLKGLSEQQKKKYGLQTAEKYFYLNQGGSCELASRDDQQNFNDIQSAMDVLGLSSKEQETIFKILVSVLHLGNVYFKKKLNDQEGVQFGSEGEIQWVSHLLELSQDWLKVGLTNKVTEARQERLLTPLTIDQALDARDAIAKAMYSRLFTWLVERINQIVQGAERDHRTTSIAILDIFGFEDFKDNSFEQLCINYANESLQFYFNKHIFRLEQAEYAREGIQWTDVDFQDNQPTIDLIARKPLGIVHMLDDESNFPKGTDISFLEKCHFNHVSNSLYQKPRLSAPEFGIRHYAGTVTYKVRNFLDKNRDTLRSDVMELLIQSKNEIISQMFMDLREATLNRTVSKLTGLYVTTKPKTPTVAASFHESLVNLMETMSKCNPWFVRCLKPNNEKAPLQFEVKVVLSQLRYSGMLETIRIRKLGYPIQLRFHTFADRYHVLQKKSKKSKRNSGKHKQGHDDKEACQVILEGLGSNWQGAWQLGSTKVFLREALAFYLNGQKNKVLTDSVLLLQRAVRGFAARRRYLQAQRATAVLQQATRAWVARMRYQRMREGFIKAQAQYRMIRQRKHYAKMRADAHQKRIENERRAEEERRRQREMEQRQQEESRRLEAEQAQWRRHEEARLRKEAQERERQVKQLSQRRLDRFDKYESVRKVSWVEAMEAEERQARTVVSVAPLEVPADLAYILGKVDDWQPVHNDRHLVNVVGNVVPRDMNFLLPEDIDSYVFSKFVHVYFKDPLQMRKGPINHPILTKTPDSEARLAVNLFNLVLRFMNDAHLNGTREKVIADYIIQMGLSHNSLRDEIYAHLCNQTWMNRNAANNERGWFLMSHCLSAFPPSQALAKYLLKYVSDHAFNGYRVYCQHKLLQCVDMEAPLCRYYPPCLLEWKASRKKAGMAVEAKFADNETGIGHVESWTTAEEFSSHLLKCRQIYDGHYGWTVSLRDGGDIYEANGHDYILDLISEMEIPPAFPWTQAPFLVMSNLSKDSSLQRRSIYDDSPHQADNVQRPVPLQVEELQDPVPVSPRPAPQPEAFFHYGSMSNLESPYVSRNQMEAEAVLSKTSILNVRYMKRPAPGPPSPGQDSVQSGGRQVPSPPAPSFMANGNHMQPLNVTIPEDQGLSSSRLNNRYAGRENETVPLASSKLNQRYGNGGLPNGNIPNGNLVNGHVDKKDYELSASRLNSRYSKHNAPVDPGKPDNRSAKNEVLRRQRSENNLEAQRASQGSRMSGAPSDMDQWLDTVFNPILDSGVDDLTDAHSLSNRLKGGGDGVPGAGQKSEPVPMTTQLPPKTNPMLVPSMAPYGSAFQYPVATNVAGAGAMGMGRLMQAGPYTSVITTGMNRPVAPVNTAFVGPAHGSIPVGPIQVVPDGSQLAVQQAYLATQQAQIEAQTSQLQSQLQQQSLQNQLLQQSVQGEILRQQLQNLQQVNNVSHLPSTPTTVLTPDGREISGRVNVVRNPNSPPAQLLASPPNGATPGFLVSMASPPRSPTMPRKPKAPVPIPAQPTYEHPRAHGEIDKRHPGGVRTLTRSFETKHPTILSPTSASRSPPQPLQVAEDFPDSRDPKVTFAKSVTHIPQGKEVSPSASPGPQRKASPPTPPPVSHPPGTIPPPPPPPPLPNQPTTKPGVIVDSSGQERAVKVGKIQWPPPKSAEKKPEPEVGKLWIDEKKVEASRRNPQSKEDVHMRTMELIRSTSKDPQQLHPASNQSTNKPPTPVVLPVVTKRRDPSPPPVAIDMESRRRALQKRLSEVGILNDSSSGSPPSPRVAERAPSPPPAHPLNMRLPSPVPPPPPPLGDREPLHARYSKRRAPEPPVAMADVVIEDLVSKEATVDMKALEHVRTQLFTQGYNPFYTYHRVPWQLEIRKEVFTPEEKAENPAVVTLLFCQIVQDVFSPNCIRILKEDRMRMRSLLETHRVNPRTVLNNHKASVKKLVIDTAREWPFYFARLFPVNGGRRLPTIQVIAVTHNGIKLLSWEKDLVQNTLHVEETFRFTDVVDVSVPKLTSLQIHIQNRYIILYSPKASLIQRLIESFCIEAEKSSIYVRATRNYVTREATLLSFQDGDVIKLTRKDAPLNKGWLYGALHGRTGLFPAEYIKPMSKHAKDMTDFEPPSGEGENLYHTLPAGGKYSMLEFAMLHFRESPFRYEMLRSEETGSIHGTFKLISSLKAKTLQREYNKKRGQPDWTWKDQANMVKWTKSPIQASLLKFESPEMNKLSLECFLSIMKFMGDYPLSKGQKSVDCVFFILKACYNHPEVRDEVYCQLVKQTTNNRSPIGDSLQQGWRFMTILTAYFDCTDILRPYLQNFLEQTAYDNQRAQQSVAAQALQNLRMTFKYGGRKNVPSRVEVEALSRGRNTKRQPCLLPIGQPIILSVRSCTVIADAIDFICTKLDISDGLQREEFTIFYVIEAENRYYPLNREEYIFDITTELANQKKEFHLLFQRTSWVFPIRLEARGLYIDMMYQQCLPDFLDGFMLPRPGHTLPEYIKEELGMLAALQLRAQDHKGVVQQKEVLNHIPRNAQQVSDMNAQRWSNLVQIKLQESAHLTPYQAKSTFLDILSKWPLFGSTFFKIKSVADPRVESECHLAINKEGVHFLKAKSHETLISYPMSEMISTRRFRNERNVNYLDMKCGNLMVQKITRVETDHGKDISILIAQYIGILSKLKQSTN